MYQRFAIHRSDDVRAVADAAGSHFFDAASMRFFNSRLLSGVLALDGRETAPGRRYLFITSERMGDDAPREYAVRMLTLSASDRGYAMVSTETVSRHSTAARARTAMESYRKAPRCESCTTSLGIVEVFHGCPMPYMVCEHCATYRLSTMATWGNPHTCAP